MAGSSKKVKNPGPDVKTDSLGRPLAETLFQDGTYDLDKWHDVFIEEADPTEYRAAIKLVSSWPRWEQLKRSSVSLRTALAAWKTELEIKMTSEAIGKNCEMMGEGDAKALTANKWLAEQGWERRQGAGRPSKSDKKRKEAEVAKQMAETKEEQERLQTALRVINGGKAHE